MWRIASIVIALLAIVGVRSHAGDAQSSATEQALIVHFYYGNADWKPFFQFEKILDDAISKSGAGYYDGNELAVGGYDGTLYMYGPDADKLLAIVKPILLSTTLLKGITATLRYGSVSDKSARVVEIRLSS